MKKRVGSVLAVLFLSCSMVSTAFATGWQQDRTGWKYQNSDGSYQSGKWFQDTTGKYYYFGNDGYMLSDTTTPDGYKVDVNGAWIQNTTKYTNAELNQAYLAVINGIRQEYGADGDYLYYTVYDVNHDGTPELCIQHGIYKNDKSWEIYSYDGSQAVLKGEYKESDYIYIATSHLDVSSDGKLYIFGARSGDTELYVIDPNTFEIKDLGERYSTQEGYEDAFAFYDLIEKQNKLTQLPIAYLTSTELLPQ